MQDFHEAGTLGTHTPLPHASPPNAAAQDRACCAQTGGGIVGVFTTAQLSEANLALARSWVAVSGTETGTHAAPSTKSVMWVGAVMHEPAV
jgi:surface antigen